MVLSIFGKRSDRTRGRSRRGPVSGESPFSGQDGTSTRSRPPTTLAEQRELARKTALKIDEIEQEMRLESPKLKLLSPSEESQKTPTARKQRSKNAARRTDNALVVANDHSNDPRATLGLTLYGKQVNALKAVTVFHGVPVIEEAAVLFANGQIDAAAQALAVARGAAVDSQIAKQLWLMELDLLSLRGDVAAFDQLAIEFVHRFETSPPVPPDGRPLLLTSEAPKPDTLQVILPAVLDSDAFLIALEYAKSGARASTVRVDCGNVRAISLTAFLALAEAFQEMERSAACVDFVSPQRLLRALKPALSDPENDVAWTACLWMFRLLGDESAFDDCALRFAAEREISPPSWAPMRPGIRVVTGGDGLVAPTPTPSSETVEVRDGRVVLCGVVEGHPETVLRAIEKQASRRSRVEVDCRKLSRLDFSAGGHLLNLIASLRQADKQCTFIQPNQLVAALLLVLGVQDYAYLQMEKT